MGTGSIQAARRARGARRWLAASGLAGALLVTGVTGTASASDASAAGDAGWQTTPLPVPYANLVAAGSIRGSDDVWATGFAMSENDRDPFQGIALRWNGGSWEQTSVPIAGEDATGKVDSRIDSPVSGAAPDDAWAVGDMSYATADGYRGQALIEHWNGTSWQQTPGDVLPDDSGLYSLDAVSTDDVWAGGIIGGSAGLAHWDGHTWSAVTPSALDGLDPVSYVTGISGSSPDDVWAVGPVGLSIHYDGHDWKQVELPDVGGDEVWLEKVRTDPTFGTWAVGYHVGSDHVRRSLALHWSGSSWETVPVPQVDDTQLEDVAFTDDGPEAYGYVRGGAQPAGYGLRLPASPSGQATAVPIAVPSQATTLYGAIREPGGSHVWIVGAGVSDSPSIFPPFAAHSTS